MRPILFCLLAIVSAPAWSEWKEVVKNSDASYYIDPATIRKNEMLVRVWSIQNLTNQGTNGEKSRRFYAEYNCKERQFKTLSLSIHSEPMAMGKVLDDLSAPSSGSYLPLNRAGVYVMDAVCN